MYLVVFNKETGRFYKTTSRETDPTSGEITFTAISLTEWEGLRDVLKEGDLSPAIVDWLIDELSNEQQTANYYRRKARRLELGVNNREFRLEAMESENARLREQLEEVLA